jgi:glycosyltransferase involved in cell wall biosynthesis
MSKFIVGQVGIPRDMYVAKMLYAEGLLDKLFTDTYFSQKSSLAKLPLVGNKLSTAFKKYDPGFYDTYISSDLFGAIYFRFLLKYNFRIEAFKFANKSLGSRLIKYASKKKPEKFYGFDTISLEFLKWSTQNDWRGYLEQCVAPRRAQIEMWKLFKEKYNLNTEPQINYALFQQEIERQEWQYANKIIVPSEYVKNEMLKDGTIKENKISVVNYGYTPHKDNIFIKQGIEKKSIRTNNEIKILFVGNAGYRKGIADLLELSNDLKHENVRFLIAGLLEQQAKELITKYSNENVTYLGKLSKENLSDQYINADIFFFPSYLEGSAMVLMEAMSWGLPIITTYQSGSTVENNVNGLLSNAGDIPALKENLLKLISDKDLRFKMGINSLERSSKYSMQEYKNNLLALLNDIN